MFLDSPTIKKLDKANILKDSLDNIELIYIKARLDLDALSKSEANKKLIHVVIDDASKSISDSMVEGMKKLSALDDADYFDVLKQVFDDEELTKSEKGQEVVKEVKEIYEKGESIFDIFQKIVDDLGQE